MSREKQLRRAQRALKRADAKRIRKVQRDERKTELSMTVVNAIMDQGDPTVSLENVIKFAVQQAHAALLYADKVTLVSPSVALMQSVDDAGNRRGIDALLELAKVAPKYFPDAATELQAFKQQSKTCPRGRGGRRMNNANTKRSSTKPKSCSAQFTKSCVSEPTRSTRKLALISSN